MTMDGRRLFLRAIRTGMGDTTIWASHSFTPVEFVKGSGDYHDVKLRVMTTGRIKGLR